MLLEQLAHRARIAALDRALESLDRRTLRGDVLFDVVAKLPPAREAVLAREHELGVGERQLRLVRKLGPHAGDGFAVAAAECPKELLGELLLLVEVRACRKGATECGRHGAASFDVAGVRASARKRSCRSGNSLPGGRSPFRGPVASCTRTHNVARSPPDGDEQQVISSGGAQRPPSVIPSGGRSPAGCHSERSREAAEARNRTRPDREAPLPG